jgi:electron transport complex protein RnfG
VRNPFVRMIVVLTIVSMFSGVVLAQTYKMTIPKIMENDKIKQENAIKSVVPGGKQVNDVSKEGIEAFEVTDENGNKVGMAFVADAGGFGGIIKLMVGIDIENRKLTGMTVLSHAETPGLGARIQESWFQEQFKDKSIDDEFAAKQDVDAITGATVSSKAVADGLRNSIERFMQVYGGEK